MHANGQKRRMGVLEVKLARGLGFWGVRCINKCNLLIY